jgi:hypothetical protein
MSRRQAPARRWHVGDPCWTPIELRMARGGIRTDWQPGEVVAVRGDQVVVRQYRWEKAYPWWRLRVPPRHVSAGRYR